MEYVVQLYVCVFPPNTQKYKIYYNITTQSNKNWF